MTTMSEATKRLTEMGADRVSTMRSLGMPGYTTKVYEGPGEGRVVCQGMGDTEEDSLDNAIQAYEVHKAAGG